MLTQDGERLAVFDAFQVDYELPKFRRQKNSDVGEEGGFGFGSDMFDSSPPHLFVHHPMNVSDPNVSVAAQVAPPIGARFGAWVYMPKEAKLSWWRRLFGADKLAGQWAKSRGVEERAYPISQSEWDAVGAAAGPLRNKRMLVEQSPELCVAFPGGRGTHNMVVQARLARVPIFTVPPSIKALVV
jgi:hypothetical protein